MVSNSKQEIQSEFLTLCNHDNQMPQNNRLICYVKLNSCTVQIELEKLILEAQPSLNAKAPHQEGIRLYHQIEVHIPYQHYQRVEIPADLILSLVLHALRQSGNSLGVQNPNDKLISGWLNCLQSSNKKPQTIHHLNHLLGPLRLWKNAVYPVSSLFRDKPKT